MIYGVKVRVVQEGTVFIEAETQDEAKKAATSEEVVFRADFPDVIEYYADEIYNADSDGREVVGNIHENPELLEEK